MLAGASGTSSPSDPAPLVNQQVLQELRANRRIGTPIASFEEFEMALNSSSSGFNFPDPFTPKAKRAKVAEKPTSSFGDLADLLKPDLLKPRSLDLSSPIFKFVKESETKVPYSPLRAPM